VSSVTRVRSRCVRLDLEDLSHQNVLLLIDLEVDGDRHLVSKSVPIWRMASSVGGYLVYSAPLSAFSAHQACTT